MKAIAGAAPVVITALPSWLNEESFPLLAAESPNYVLQVHSLHLPQGAQKEASLVDEDETRQAVARAAEVGVPFRLALPTYASVVQFSEAGNVTEVYAEDLPPTFGLQSRRHLVLAADAHLMSRLVQEWRAGAPALMRAIIWYRLPVTTDRLNWPLPVLAKVCRGEPLKRGWSVGMRRAEGGHGEIVLRNDGDAPDSPPRQIRVQWRDESLQAADGLRGYTAREVHANALELRLEEPGTQIPLPAGAELVAGWVRLDRAEAEVKIVVE